MTFSSNCPFWLNSKCSKNPRSEKVEWSGIRGIQSGALFEVLPRAGAMAKEEEGRKEMEKEEMGLRLPE